MSRLVPLDLNQRLGRMSDAVLLLLYTAYKGFICAWAETCGNAALENIAKPDQNLEIQAYADKLCVIKEVLARRHMKVAFFGR